MKLLYAVTSRDQILEISLTKKDRPLKINQLLRCEGETMKVTKIYSDNGNYVIVRVKRGIKTKVWSHGNHFELLKV